MSAELAIVSPPAQADLTAIERVVVAGDLSKLTPDERWNYYRGVCQSVGLNPFTQPFLYITLGGKLVLYATKGAADQLRDNHHISIGQPAIDLSDGLCIVTVTATDRTGRTDSDLGIVPVENLRGDAKANAILKAVTKAKRRVTLSMCGLGMLDETEVETIPNAQPANVPVLPAAEPAAQPDDDMRAKLSEQLRKRTDLALSYGIDIEVLDPDELDIEELRGTVRSLGEMVKTVKAEMDKQAAAPEPAGQPAPDDDSDDSAPF